MKYPSISAASLLLWLAFAPLVWSEDRVEYDRIPGGHPLDYGSEAIHLHVSKPQQGPQTLKLRRLLKREHRIDTNNYILLAVLVDNPDTYAAGNGFARLSIGRIAGEEVTVLPGQTRLLAPADERRDWQLYLSGGAEIQGFTAILAPREFTRYQSDDYGYFDRGYIQGGATLGWIWRDRFYRQRVGDRRFHRRWQGSHRYGSPRRAPVTNLPIRPARPGFGDRDIYAHERAERRQFRQQLKQQRQLERLKRNRQEAVQRPVREAKRQRANEPRPRRAREAANPAQSERRPNRNRQNRPATTADNRAVPRRTQQSQQAVTRARTATRSRSNYRARTNADSDSRRNLRNRAPKVRGRPAGLSGRSAARLR